MSFSLVKTALSFSSTCTQIDERAGVLWGLLILISLMSSSLCKCLNSGPLLIYLCWLCFLPLHAGNTISWTHKLFRSISWSQSLSFKLNDSFGLCYSDSCKSISVYKNSNTNVRIRLFSWKLHFSSLAIVWSSVAVCTTKFAWVQTKSHILSSWSNCMFSTLCTVEDRLWKCNKQSQKTKMVLPMRQMKCSLFLEKTSCYFWTKHAFRNIWKEFK